MTRILVGVDASEASVEALDRAAAEARWRDASLEVLYAFAPPEPMAAFPVPVERGTDVRDVEAEREKASRWLAEWIDGLDVDFSGIEVELSIVADRKPAHALVERSDGAELVVVGSRGRGGFAGLRLGSTSEQVTRHAHCPVLVVRDPKKA